MLNQVIIVGRVVKDIEVKMTNEGKKYAHIVLAVSRNYKNSESGKYETDFISSTLWENIASTTSSHCKKGSIIGLKGRLVTKTIEAESKKYTVLDLVADSVTFISTGVNKDLNQVQTTNVEVF